MLNLLDKTLNLLDKTMWNYVIQDISKEMEYLPYAALLGLLVYTIFRILSPKKGKKVTHFIKAILLIYLFALIHITLFEREPGSRTGISLILFETVGGSRSNAYVIENVLLFIPFGFLIAGVFRPMKNIIFSLFSGALCSLLIETTQLVSQRGHFQVDDILTNCIGTGIGCLCFWLIRGSYLGCRRFIN